MGAELPFGGILSMLSCIGSRANVHITTTIFLRLHSYPSKENNVCGKKLMLLDKGSCIGQPVKCIYVFLAGENCQRTTVFMTNGSRSYIFLERQMCCMKNIWLRLTPGETKMMMVG